MVRSTSFLRQAVQALRPLPHPALKLSKPVNTALNRKSAAPLVALESTIITHGLPYPYNLDVAKELEQTVRDQGAVPATIALLDGQPLVGLDDQQLERLARCAIDPSKNEAIKASRRDIAHVLAKGKGTVGGTTVSGTMVLAHMAGIPIFATGGIGGVHRGAESTMDISADLTELGRTPVAVFCSGPKSILDIPRTLEVLETFGVSVTTFNPTGEFPAFYTSTSGLRVPYAGSDAEAASSIFASLQMGLQSGQVFGNPIPSEWEQIGAKIQDCVELAVQESIENGVYKKGKQVTPWLLKRLAELIPESKESNRALVVNNAKKAAKVAVELHKITKDAEATQNTHSLGSVKHSSSSISENIETLPEILVFGAAAVDLTSQAMGLDRAKSAATTHPGRVTVTLGGVARNVAETAARALSSEPSAVKLVSPHGQDDFGLVLRKGMQELGMRVDGLFCPPSTGQDARTAVCSLLLDGEGDLISGVADMEIGQRHLYPGSHVSLTSYLRSNRPRIVAFDGNIGERQSDQLLHACQEHNRQDPSHAIQTIFEPTSLTKSLVIFLYFQRLASAGASSQPITYATPNLYELDHMYDHAQRLGLVGVVGSSSDRTHTVIPDEVLPHSAVEKGELLIKAGIFERLLIKAGRNGVVSISAKQVRHHPIPIGPVDVVNTTGCGDSFAGGFIAALSRMLRYPKGEVEHELLDKAILAGQLAARNTLQSVKAVGEGMHEVLERAGIA